MRSQNTDRADRPDYVQNPLQLLLDCHAAQSATTGFTAIFTKRERIEGRLREPETMFIKCRYVPFSIYCKWVKNPNKDREIIYVEGQNRNMVIGHQPPLPIEIRREPSHPDALKESLFPVTCAGILPVTKLLTDVALVANKAGDLRLFCTEETYNGRPAWRLLRVLPKKADYPAFLCYIYVDKEWMAPVRITTFDWDDNLISTYTFSDVTLNPPLTDMDFSRYNPSYHWPLSIFEKPHLDLSRKQ